MIKKKRRENREMKTSGTGREKGKNEKTAMDRRGKE